MKSALFIKDLVEMNKIIQDLWDRNVTAENFDQWRSNNLQEICGASITLKVMMDDVNKLVDVNLLEGTEARGMVENA